MDAPFYLFRGTGGRKVSCRTRWISDEYAYVVAPLATATSVRQHWNAATDLPAAGRGNAGGQRQLEVELVSAEALLGSDSGREGLLLRFLRPRSTPVDEPPGMTDLGGGTDAPAEA